MRPGDHPEFFRLPPPPGASRESHIRLDRDGRFFHEGLLVEKPSLARALHRWLAVHPDDGRFILTNGYDWCYVDVEGTPYFVEGLRGEPDGVPTAILSDGTSEPLDLGSLAVGEDGVCIAWVKRGRFQARFSRHAQVELASWLAPDEPVRVVVRGKSFPIHPACQVDQKAMRTASAQ